MELKRNIFIVLAILLLILGIVCTPTPLPGTTLMIIFSLTYLISVSDTAAFFIKHLRNKFKPINKFFVFIEGKTREKTRNILSRTDPKTIIKGESIREYLERMRAEREKEQEEGNVV